MITPHKVLGALRDVLDEVCGGGGLKQVSKYGKI
jgi:hypothetical protein